MVSLGGGTGGLAVLGTGGEGDQARVGGKRAQARDDVDRGGPRHAPAEQDQVRPGRAGESYQGIRKGAVKKGDPLQAARLAGIMAAKQTSSLIPLCHPLPIASVHVELIPIARGYDIEARVRTTAQTGVEMEALTAVAIAALTIYDMVKAVDKAMVIGKDGAKLKQIGTQARLDMEKLFGGKVFLELCLGGIKR